MPTDAAQGDRTGAGTTGRPATGAASPHADAGTYGNGRDLTITVPLDRAIGVATAPLASASRVLSAKGGLPLYAGLGVLAVADVITWPVAASVGAGYAIMRRWGALGPRAVPADAARETSAPAE